MGRICVVKKGLTNRISYAIIPRHSRSATQYRGVEQLEARRAHNPEVVGSSPASATNIANRFRYRRKKSSNLGGYWIFYPFLKVKLKRYPKPKTALGEDLN